jgi:hypothetical protein
MTHGLLVGGGARLAINQKDIVAQHTGNLLSSNVKVTLGADGGVVITKRNDAGGDVPQTLEPWLLKGQPSEVEVRYTVISGQLSYDSGTMPQIDTWISAAANHNWQIGSSTIFPNNSMEIQVEYRAAGSGKDLGGFHIYLRSTYAAGGAPVGGLRTHTIRGTGSSGLPAHAIIQLNPDGTSVAGYTNNGTLVNQALENWRDAVFPNVDSVMVRKVVNPSVNLYYNSGLGKILPVVAPQLLWSKREPENERRTIGLQFDFFQGSSPMYSVVITLEADRTTTANGGVT